MSESNPNPPQVQWQWPLPPPPQPPRREWRPVVIAAIIAGLAGLVIGAVIGGAIVFGLSASGVLIPNPLTRGPGGSLAQFDLAVGQCANGVVEPGHSFGGDATVPCEQSHDFEVYSSTSAPGAAQGARYPDPKDLGLFADDHCLLAFQAFVGIDYESSDLDYAAIVPSRAAWDAGDRTVLCALWASEPMAGSARGTER